METIVHIEQLNFGYIEPLYSMISLDIEKGKFISLMGPSKSGKSTLAGIIHGDIKIKSPIMISNENISNKNDIKIKKKIGYVKNNNEKLFIGNSVKQSFSFNLKKYGYSLYMINKKMLEIFKLFDIVYLMNVKISDMSEGERHLVALAIEISHDPILLILDETLSQIDFFRRKKIFEILKCYIEKGLTVLNITNNSEDLLYSDELIILNNKEIKYKGSVIESFNKLKIYKDNAIELPFIIELSSKLKYYKVIDKNYTSIKEMVDYLWK